MAAPSKRPQLAPLFEAVIAAADDAVIIAAANGVKVVFVNAAFSRLTGYGIEEIAGQVPRQLRPWFDRIGAAACQRQPGRAELVGCARDGREYCVELTI